jgi:hypothetical protein
VNFKKYAIHGKTGFLRNQMQLEKDEQSDLKQVLSRTQEDIHATNS